MNALIKKITFAFCGLGLSLFSVSAHAYGYLNTDSFWIVEGSGGVGKLLDQNITSWSAGGGYQWVLSDSATVGFEGLYLDNGSWTEGQNSASSKAVVPFVSLYYYLTPKFNVFGKVGYGYEMNDYEVNGTALQENSFRPAGIAGMGYLIPFSSAVYLNLFTNLTWMDQNNDDATQLSSETSPLKNMQFNFGAQLMF